MYLRSTKTRCAIAILASGVTLAGSSTAQQASPFSNWTDEQKEEFLRTAEVIDTDEVSVGITRPLRATLRLGDSVHDAHIQRINERAPIRDLPTGRQVNFRDYWGFNIAAYRLDRLLGLHIVPVAIERKYKRTAAAFSWWIDDVAMMERDRWEKDIEPPDRDAWNRQMHNARVFNQLVYNTDPNLGNVLIDKDWKIWLIDYTRAFRIQGELLKPEGLTMIDGKLLASMRAMTPATVKAARANHGRHAHQTRTTSTS